MSSLDWIQSMISSEGVIGGMVPPGVTGIFGFGGSYNQFLQLEYSATPCLVIHLNCDLWRHYETVFYAPAMAVQGHDHIPFPFDLESRRFVLPGSDGRVTGGGAVVLSAVSRFLDSVNGMVEHLHSTDHHFHFGYPS